MERHEILELMSKLKLAGVRTAFDELIADGLKRQHPVQRCDSACNVDPL